MATATTQNISTSATSAVSSPSSTCNLGASACPTPSPGTLYLFTFLATVVLLTLVTGTIVVRSMYLRRRHRLLVASGRWVPPAPPRPKGEVDLKQKPRIFDAYLGESASEFDWESVPPFSATSASTPTPSKPPQSASQPQVNSAMPSFQMTTQFNPIRNIPWSRRIAPHTSINILAAPQHEPEVIPLLEMSPSKRRVSVQYIIAMPCQTAPLRKSESEGDEAPELPFLEFGIAEVDVSGAGDELSLFGESQGKPSGEVDSSLL
ncbi:hypothetical protein DFH07DRAFT_830448, partial [Mycena maculata]